MRMPGKGCLLWCRAAAVTVAMMLVAVVKVMLMVAGKVPAVAVEQTDGLRGASPSAL